MAGVKISALPAVASALITDFLPVVQGGVTSQETLLQIRTLYGFDSVTGLLAMSKGGTNANLTAANGAVPYSTASAFALLAAGTSGQIFQSGGAGAPNWTTTTYPTTNAINTIMYASSANVLGVVTPVNSALLISSGAGVPSWSNSAIPAFTMAGAISMGSHLINNLTDPVSAQDAATKNYVDNIATGGGAPVVAASTGALTVTQAGAGVGATLTNAGAQATFALDGQNPTVGQRVLIKNQASNTQNGVYTVTNVGSGATNWVLTRATDYDTPTDINDTGIIPVQAGTVNINTGWINTTLMVTVDTTAITFIQFGVSFPVSLANGGTNANLTASNGSVVYSTASAMAFSAVGSTGQILQSAGAGTPTWSTPTYPSTSGTAGKVLISDGTNNVYSTPTYPNTSGSAGVILRSNGTNNVYSTSTFADTYSASNLLYSNGANTVAGLATANSGVLVTSGAGVPSILVGPGSANFTLLSSAAGTPAWSTQPPFTKINVVNITSTQTYTPSAGTQYALVELWGGGGGGGSSNSATIPGSGGGAGAYSYSFIHNPTAVTVAIGSAGTGGTSNNGSNGGNGGDTTYNTTTVVAKGGTGAASSGGAGGAGGAAASGAGNITYNGGNGSTTPAVALVYPCPGGNSPRNVTVPSITGYGFVPNVNSGAGGCGGNLTNNAGNGANGLAIITEYIVV